EIDLDGPATQRDAQPVGTVDECERAFTESQRDLSCSRRDLGGSEFVDVTVPAVAAHRAHDAPEVAWSITGCGIVDEAEIDDQIEIVRRETEVKPLLVTRARTEAMLRTAQAIAELDRPTHAGLPRVNRVHRSRLPLSPDGAASGADVAISGDWTATW